MKKLIILVCIMANVLFAQSSSRGESLTRGEQQDLVQFLKSKISQGDKSKAFELGLLYEDGILNAKDEKVPDMQEALKYFIMSFESKDYRSSFKIATALLNKKENKKALDVIKEAVENSKSRSLVIGAATTYGTMAMDYFPNDKNVLIDGVYNFAHLTKEELNKVPTAKFVNGLLLGAIGNTKEGEKLLNEACYSINAPDELKKKCFNPKNFDLENESKDVKKSINEPCCNLLQD